MAPHVNRQQALAASQGIVDFHGHALTVITGPAGEHLVAMKPICEAIGLGWQSQYNRIQRDEVLSTCVVVMNMQMPEDDQSREVTCLPIDYLNGWLFGIDVARCREEIRPSLIQYKRECYAVLAAYWQQGEAINPRKTRKPKALPSGLTTDQQEAIKGMVKARVEALPESRQAGAAIRCWSSLKSKFGCTYKDIDPARFTEAVSLLARLPLEGEFLPKQEIPAPAQQLDIHYPADCLEGRRPGMRYPCNENTDFLDVSLLDLGESFSSPCEEILAKLGRAGYNVDGAWWEIRTYRNKMAHLRGLIASLQRDFESPQQYVINKV